jgi:hypothetical protein
MTRSISKPRRFLRRPLSCQEHEMKQPQARLRFAALKMTTGAQVNWNYADDADAEC